MRIAICDDEKKFLDKLKKMIKTCYPSTEKLSISEFYSGEQFLLEFELQKYDVIFLDIEMRALTGLDVAKKIRMVDKSVIIAFLTGHQEFAVNGYEVNAFRYLLKNQPDYMYERQFQSIFDEYHQTHMTFQVKELNTVFNILVSDIVYFEIFKRTIILHTKYENYQFNGRLSDIEKDERLVNFVKPHKSYYVNIAFVDHVEPNNICIKNMDKIPMSRNYRQAVTEKFISYFTGMC